MSDGNLVVASGHGIDFSASSSTGATGATTTSELLDDYEEGDWTPASTAMPVETVHTAKYTKIGSFCAVYCDITRASSPSDTSQGSGISGMPFSAGDDYPCGFSHINNQTEAILTLAGGASMNFQGVDRVNVQRSQVAGNRAKHFVTFMTL